MMKLLIAPTQLELSAITFQHDHLHKIICGVGGISLAKTLIPILEHKQQFDEIILIGLAGSISIDYPLTEVVKVKNDIQGDLGVFENGSYHSFEEIGLIASSNIVSAKNLCLNILPELKTVNALSTNILFDEKDKNELRHAYYNTQIENMEGAAFHQICEQYKIPFLHLRAISNLIGERDKNNWQIEKALNNLNLVTTQYLEYIL